MPYSYFAKTYKPHTTAIKHQNHNAKFLKRIRKIHVVKYIRDLIYVKVAVVGDALESLREYVNGSPEGFEDSDHDHILAGATIKLTARDSRRRKISNETTEEGPPEEDEATLRELLVR